MHVHYFRGTDGLSASETGGTSATNARQRVAVATLTGSAPSFLGALSAAHGSEPLYWSGGMSYFKAPIWGRNWTSTSGIFFVAPAPSTPKSNSHAVAPNSRVIGRPSTSGGAGVPNSRRAYCGAADRRLFVPVRAKVDLMYGR